MKTIRIGMIGLGQIARQHLENYTQKLPGVEIVAAADINAETLERVSERYNIPHRYTRFQDLLERDDIDAVDVCLHNNFHAPVTIAALEAAKHVYCEKPMAGAYIDAQAMFDVAKRTGRNLSIQLASLFRLPTRAARRLIDAGKLGRIYHARSTGYRRRGRPFVDGYGTESFVQKHVSAGGALFDMGVYNIARMLYLLGLPEVDRISGKIYQETPMDEHRRKCSGYNVEELGLGFVKFDNGLTLDIQESWAVHLNEFEGSSIIGSEGGIRLDPFSYHATVADMEMDATFNLKQIDTRWHRCNELEGAYDGPQQHWIAALQGRVPLLPTAEIALKTMLISEGIYLSDALGREVTADEVVERSRSTAIAVS